MVNLLGRPVRQFSVVFRRMSASLDQEFQNAKGKLNTLKEDPGNEAKLKLYGLFKQATSGQCKMPKPGMMDFVGRAKWDAWNNLGPMSADEAKTTYINVVQDLLKSAGAEETEAPTPAAGAGGTEWIEKKKEGKIFHIILNRADKKNALTQDMYNSIREGLETAAKDKDSVLTVLSGRGDYFSSGNDLGNFLGDLSDKAALAQKSKDLLQNYVAAFIDHPKPLIALINGPAIGISVTVLGLFDLVYASDRATFNTPFSALGQSPEGCASFTFPRLMGLSKASEFLLFGKKLSAVEACERGLVTEVFPHDTFAEETRKRIQAYSQLPPQSMKLSKQLIRDSFRDELHKANADECELLRERWQSDECAEAVMNFFASRSKM